MKKIITTMVLAAGISAAMAQANHRHSEVRTMEAPGVSVKMEVSTSETIETQTDSAATDIIGADSVRVYNSLVSRTNNTWTLNFLSITNEEQGEYMYVKKKGHSSCYSEIGAMDLYLGYAGLTDMKGFEQSHGKSLELGFNFMRTQMWNSRRTFGLQAALGMSWTRNLTRDNLVFQLDNNGDLYVGDWKDAEKPYSRARLTYVSWRMPVLLTLQTSNQKIGFSAGAELENRHHVRSRVKYGKEKRHDVLRRDMDVNPWGCNLLGKISFDKVSIYGRYSLTPLFGTKHTLLEATPYSVGISLNLD